ncbi:MAG: hypothetical protein EPN33_13825 [Acidobacteria bacterium]|nr:MAG: hypothetical protein EPN33_13825 [Acidobacteriota bacterium]
MASLHVRNLDEDLVKRLKLRAARHGRSAEAEHREILRQALGSTSSSFEDLARAFRRRLAGRHHTPSEQLLRESRRER